MSPNKPREVSKEHEKYLKLLDKVFDVEESIDFDWKCNWKKCKVSLKKPKDWTVTQIHILNVEKSSNWKIKLVIVINNDNRNIVRVSPKEFEKIKKSEVDWQKKSRI